MAHDAFISHSSEDKAVADATCAALEQAGIRCWITPRDIRPGQSWGGAIVDAIGASRVMVLIFSAQSNSSKQVVREVERAVQKDVIVVPFRIEGVEPSKDMEYFLSATHWLDAMTPPLNAHLQSLVTTIQSILNDAESERSAGGADTPPQPAPAPQAAPPARTEKRGYGNWATLALALVLLAFLGIRQPWQDQSETPTDPEPSQAQTQTREVGTSEGGSLQAEASVLTGAHIRVEWSGPDGVRDFIAIGRPDDGPDGYNSYTYTSKGNPLKVRVPDEPGEWELRYVSGSPRAILARSPLQVVAAEASLQASPRAVTGSHVSVTWNGPDHVQDYIAIARPDTTPGNYDNYTYTGKGNPLQVRAPDKAGLYELRYASGHRGTIFARAPLEVIAAEASLQASPRAVTGSHVSVTWNGPDHVQDYVAVAEPDATPGNYDNYTYTGKGNPLQVRAPDEPGLYELRYASGHRGTIFARAPLEVIAAEASLQAPESAPAGSRVRVEWQGPDNNRDYIAIARPDTAAGRYEAYTYTSEGSPLEVKTPDAPGSYELRYASGQHGTIWARRPLLVE